MRRKKRDRKRKSDPPVRLTSEEEALVKELLQDLRKTDPVQLASRVPDPHLAEILIERLPLDEDTPAVLLALKEGFEQKPIRRAVKRALFRLKKKGIFTDESDREEPPSPGILKPMQKEEPDAFLGPVHLNGTRAVLIILHRAAKGQDVGLGLVSDEEGMHQFHYGVFSRKRTKELKAYISQEAGPLVNTKLSHATTVLEHAYRRHLELYPEAPQDYLEIRPWLLERSALLDRPIIYEVIPEGEISEGVLTDSQLEKLFEHDLMKSWFVDFESLRQYMKDILNVEDSPIVLTELQKQDRIRQIKEKITEDLFPTAKRVLLKHKFEEMAYIFLKLDQEEYARLCLVAAGDLDQAASILTKNPVIEFLIERSLDFYANATQEIAEGEMKDEKSSELIILP